MAAEKTGDADNFPALDEALDLVAMADEMVTDLAEGGGFDDRVLKTMPLRRVRSFLALVVARIDEHLLEIFPDGLPDEDDEEVKR